MKNLRKISIAIILVVLAIILANSVDAFDPNATLWDLYSDVKYGKYKYLFYYNLYSDFDNMWCVRGGDALSDEKVPKNKQNEHTLHRLTTVVEINGYNAKFYAGDGHCSGVKEGTLLHESNCEENNIMASILYNGHRVGCEFGE